MSKEVIVRYVVQREPSDDQMVIEKVTGWWEYYGLRYEDEEGLVCCVGDPPMGASPAEAWERSRRRLDSELYGYRETLRRDLPKLASGTLTKGSILVEPFGVPLDKPPANARTGYVALWGRDNHFIVGRVQGVRMGGYELWYRSADGQNAVLHHPDWSTLPNEESGTLAGFVDAALRNLAGLLATTQRWLDSGQRRLDTLDAAWAAKRIIIIAKGRIPTK